jgi:hypothetical protein
MPNIATMQQRLPIAQQAIEDIVKWLRSKSETVEIINVENEKHYQDMDVDLIWKTKDGDIKIEVKGDRYHTTGNFFLETFSSEELQTPGCFMYTEADFVYYYFVGIKRLYIMPMPDTRIWFKEHLTNFRESKTHTDMGYGKHYTTVGRLVPIKILMENVPSISIVQF